MARNMFEDIKPISRSAQNAEIKLRPKPVEKVRVPVYDDEEKVSVVEERTIERKIETALPRRTLPREIPFSPEAPKHTSMHALWYVAALIVIAFFLSLSFLFERATVTVIPKSVPVALDSSDVFTAQKDSTAVDAVVFTEMTLSGDQTMALPSTQTKALSESAKGTAVIYNTYSAAAYKLAVNTRLQTPDGRIYKINSAAVIPGYTKSGTTITPGSVEVMATAAVPGEAGNLTVSDFSIPGLAGTPQATKIYARSKTAFTGGISGTVYTIPQTDADAALGTLSGKLKDTLVAKAKVQIPDGYLFYDTATVFTSDNTVAVPYSQTTQVPIALHGTLTAYLVKEDTLVKAIAEKFVSQYSGESVTVPGLSSFSLMPSAALTPKTDTSFAFSLNGSGSVVWTVDPSSIVTLLQGTKKASFENLLSGAVGVDKAEVVIKPFWKQSFPIDPKRITVTVKNPQ